jgi:hypothetical protein
MSIVTHQARQPSGTPVGGQFAAVQHPDGPDLAPTVVPREQLDAVINGKIKTWVESNLNGYAETGVLDLMDIDEDEAIERYGPEIGGFMARLVITVQSDTVELSPAVYEGPLAGPAEYDTGGHVMVIDIGRHGRRTVVASSMFSGTDPPVLPPFSSWVEKATYVAAEP